VNRRKDEHCSKARKEPESSKKHGKSVSPQLHPKERLHTPYFNPLHSLPPKNVCGRELRRHRSLHPSFTMKHLPAPAVIKREKKQNRKRKSFVPSPITYTTMLRVERRERKRGGEEE
jgi:hypothetical protein